MTTERAHLAGIGDVHPDHLKTVLARLFPVPSAPSQKAVRERLDDAHPDFI